MRDGSGIDIDDKESLLFRKGGHPQHTIDLNFGMARLTKTAQEGSFGGHGLASSLSLQDHNLGVALVVDLVMASWGFLALLPCQIR